MEKADRIEISPGVLFLFCFFLYPVMFKASSIISFAYMYGIPSLYLIVNFKMLKNIGLYQYIILSLSVLLVVMSLAYPTYHGTYDYSYLTVATFVFRKIIVFLFLICMLAKRYGMNTSTELFMYYYALTHAMYVIGTLILVVFPQVKNIWFTIFAEVTASSELLKSYGYTFRIGWQGFSGYRLTFHCTICCLFLLYLYFVNNSNFHINYFQFIVTFSLCLLGNMFYGRSGLVLTILVSLAALLIWNRMHFIRVLSSVVVLSMLGLGIYSLRDSPLISDWYYWVSKPISNLITTGSFNNYSVDNMKNMVFVPEIRTIVLGDGRFTQYGHYYMNTDSGIVRNILFWGLGGALVSYGMTLFSFARLWKRNELLALLLMTIFAVFEVKGDVYYEIVTLLLAISFIDEVKMNYFENG